MATSPSPASSAVHSPSVSVETLVEHLLAAKRSLASVRLVLRANDLTTHARQLHEESVILGAQTAFLRTGVGEQIKLLARVTGSMNKTYKASRREFNSLIKTLDTANDKLKDTMDMLRGTAVDPVFRPEGEDPKNLLDFVDETQVDGIVNALKASLVELQATLTSFDGDLLRLENDMRTLKQALESSASPPSPGSPGDSGRQRPNLPPIHDLLRSLTEQSHSMATHLVSLNRHFDMCVTAVRITEGGAALARRKAAEDSGEADPVSISGVIDQQETNIDDLDPAAKSEIVQVVMQDSPEVDEVVADLNAEMHQVDVDFSLLKHQTDQIQSAHTAIMQAFHIMDDIGSRLQGYIAAEVEFINRWEVEKDSIFARLEEMENLRYFYDGYANAYDSLILEVKRRRAVETKIQGIWRKAKEAVDKLVETDWKDRETFRSEVGDYIPTDLWVGMSGPLRKWEVVRAQVDESSASPEDDKIAEYMQGQDEAEGTTAP
ncbi:autophagy-related protein 17 [Cryphonectria parasitica EP155]|uniref:Autophagy-related protein 17 n=1 Tax=Cryphonectria parasitica (strain ATCC 38755 / EP155) TaxID=660469 RepID=A0A9P5CU46_CRYP1|nr:autophagy-related protein 17 [Cryphonectria parasitica EP155]KAF3769760.1 autophagy-related protein 17 [Cryphonectria parasitica EP155]